jgi:hypothetical protein
VGNTKTHHENADPYAFSHARARTHTHQSLVGQVERNNITSIIAFSMRCFIGQKVRNSVLRNAGQLAEQGKQDEWATITHHDEWLERQQSLSESSSSYCCRSGGGRRHDCHNYNCLAPCKRPPHHHHHRRRRRRRHTSASTSTKHATSAVMLSDGDEDVTVVALVDARIKVLDRIQADSRKWWKGGALPAWGSPTSCPGPDRVVKLPNTCTTDARHGHNKQQGLTKDGEVGRGTCVSSTQADQRGVRAESTGWARTTSACKFVEACPLGPWSILAGDGRVLLESHFVRGVKRRQRAS